MIYYRWTGYTGCLQKWELVKETEKMLFLRKLDDHYPSEWRLHKNKVDKAEWDGGVWATSPHVVLNVMNLHVEQERAKWLDLQRRVNRYIKELSA